MHHHGFLLLASLALPVSALAQLPATPPTASNRISTADRTAPIAATPLPASSNSGPTPARVTCNGGLLQVKAQNSSLNGILRSIARCTGMHISGSIPEQRVFGDYGPAEPATVLATLVDGSETNMLLRETSADQPAELILTPRTGGGPTPPPPSSYAEADENGTPAQSAPQQQLPPRIAMPMNIRGRGFLPGRTNSGASNDSSNQTPTLPPITGSPVTSPQSIPQPINNVNGSASNVSPTAGTYPTTNSVPLDALRTPSTTPSTSGIVDAPNGPPAGSDTAALLNGAARGTPGTTNISPDNTAPTSTPGATNTTVPANPANQGSSTDLTPEQIFQQLQQRQRSQQEQQQQQDNTSTSPM